MTINKEDTFYPKDSRRLKILLIVIGLAFIIFIVYKSFFNANADYRFTVAEVTGEYHDSKVFGITFTYKVDGKEIKSDCIDNECHNLSRGTRCIVKYFIDKPNWNSLYPNVIVPIDISPPVEGWEEIPLFLLVKKQM